MAIELLQTERPAKRTLAEVLREFAEREDGAEPVDAVVVFSLHKGETLDTGAVHFGDFADAAAAVTLGKHDWLMGGE